MSGYETHHVNYSLWTVPQRYRDLTRLGSGAYAQVCSAYDRKLNKVSTTIRRKYRLTINFQECGDEKTDSTAENCWLRTKSTARVEIDETFLSWKYYFNYWCFHATRGRAWRHGRGNGQNFIFNFDIKNLALLKGLFESLFRSFGSIPGVVKKWWLGGGGCFVSDLLALFNSWILEL